MSDMAFLPAMITVSVGQNIVWKNSSPVIHNVVDDASKALDMADVMLPSSVKLFDSNFCNPVTLCLRFHGARNLPLFLHSA